MYRAIPATGIPLLNPREVPRHFHPLNKNRFTKSDKKGSFDSLHVGGAREGSAFTPLVKLAEFTASAMNFSSFPVMMTTEQARPHTL